MVSPGRNISEIFGPPEKSELPWGRSTRSRLGYIGLWLEARSRIGSNTSKGDQYFRGPNIL